MMRLTFLLLLTLLAVPHELSAARSGGPTRRAPILESEPSEREPNLILLSYCAQITCVTTLIPPPSSRS